MSHKNKKTDSDSNAGPEVFEGEIIDGATSASTSSNTNGLPPEKSPFKGIITISAVVVVLVVGGWLGLPLIKGGLGTLFPSMFSEEQAKEVAVVEEDTFSPKQAFSELSDTSALLLNRVGELESKIYSLERETTKPQEAQVTGAVDSGLVERVASLEQIVDELENMEQVPVLDMAPDLSALVERIAILERAATRQETPEPAPEPEAIAASTSRAPEANYFMSLVSLSRAVTAGRPFKTQVLELEAYAKVANVGDKALFGEQLNALKSMAEKGVPTDNDVLDLFNSVSRLAMVAEFEAGERSWWQKVWSDIKGLVTIRQKGEVAGDDIGALLARAEVRIERGDYAEAQQILLGTTLNEQQALSPLLEMLQSKISASGAINILLTTGLEGRVQ